MWTEAQALAQERAGLDYEIHRAEELLSQQKPCTQILEGERTALLVWHADPLVKLTQKLNRAVAKIHRHDERIARLSQVGTVASTLAAPCRHRRHRYNVIHRRDNHAQRLTDDPVCAGTARGAGVGGALD
jgi:hypothetical protein